MIESLKQLCLLVFEFALNSANIQRLTKQNEIALIFQTYIFAKDGHSFVKNK
jgi:hypothetical protein